MPKYNVKVSEFAVSCADCVQEITQRYGAKVTTELTFYWGYKLALRPVWVVKVAFPDLGVLERWEYLTRADAVNRNTADPYASLYGTLVDVVRHLDNHKQAKFWLGSGKL